jgi:putative ABC transport system substrate-binding protein
MKRRDFIVLLGGATAAWPLAARAQQAGRLPTVGFLVPGTRASYAQWVAAFTQRMSELGWTDGRNVATEYRWTEGHGERTAEIAAEFVRLKVDVIVTSGAANVIAAKRASAAIPIVFAATADPVAAGFVASLARPGGNITGLSAQSTDYVGKQLDLLREIVPAIRRLAVLANADSPGAMLEMGQVQVVARTLGLEVVALEIRRADDITAAFAGLKDRADALYRVPDPLMSTNRIRITTSALDAGVPAIYGSRDYVDAGGLISYGPNISDLFRRAADFVDKILHGTRPADIPVEQPTKFYLFVNLTTAKALGVAIPEKVLALADEVIE